MFTRKKMSENIAPVGMESVKNQLPSKGFPTKSKRVAGGTRSALGDIVNTEAEKISVIDGKKKIPVSTKPQTKVVTKSTTSLTTKATSQSQIPAPVVHGAIAKKVVKKDVLPVQVTGKEQIAPPAASRHMKKSKAFSTLPIHRTSSEIDSADIDLDSSVSIDRVEEDISVIEQEAELLAFDSENFDDIFHVAIYAQDIFEYYKNRECMFEIPAYMSQGDYPVKPAMRSILVDWMVEIQENFELNHETLYLGVKLTDLYLSRTHVTKDDLQLVGAVALFVASKFDEQRYPLIEDFTYVCDNAFDADQFLQKEMDLLKQIDFDLGIPLSYRFLRRYAKVGKLSIETLTLARFILEMSLMDAEFISVRDSKVAAASLYLAMKMRKEGTWAGDFVKGSGYEMSDFKSTLVGLNRMIRAPPSSQLTNIRSKYSHSVFHAVAKIPTISTEKVLS